MAAMWGKIKARIALKPPEILLKSRANDQDDFVEQGASFLQNGTLISFIQKRLDCRISMRQFLQNIRVQNLVFLVEGMTSTAEPFAYLIGRLEFGLGIEGRVFLTGPTGTLERYDIWSTLLMLIHDIMALEGDMKKPDLGLGAERFA
ncbi:NRPS-like protein biosynthetic cluster [Penicillium frequentans]|nr:NRPS-like protein biosynthetic cluster [Penicillium glabrum]